jgi:hypothetical protein
MSSVIHCYIDHLRGRHSSVGVATRYGLNGPGIESRWGRKFPHPSTPALTLLHNGHRVSFLGVKRPGRGVDYTPPSSAEVKERVDLCLCFPTGPSCHVLPFHKSSVVKGREGVTSTPASYLESHGFRSWP